MTKELARKRVHLLKSYFDEYNETGFCDIPKEYLFIYQNIVSECFEVIKYLWSIERNAATSAYMIFCGKLMLRLSYVREHNRKETDQETAAYFKFFNEKYRLIGSIND